MRSPISTHAQIGVLLARLHIAMGTGSEACEAKHAVLVVFQIGRMGIERTAIRLLSCFKTGEKKSCEFDKTGMDMAWMIFG